MAVVRCFRFLCLLEALVCCRYYKI